MNSCYKVKLNDYPNSIFWLYDISYVRKNKICKLNNKKFSISKNNIKGIFLFEQVLNQKIIFCDRKEIWSFFEKNYIDDYNKIQKLIDSIITDFKSLTNYTSHIPYFGDNFSFIINEKQVIKIETYE